MTAKSSLLAAATAFALAVVATPVLADSGPSDAQIAHIAYTAGALDVAAAKAFTSLFSDFFSACFAAVISMTPAV
jgi:predicted outer membrane protein